MILGLTLTTGAVTILVTFITGVFLILATLIGSLISARSAVADAKETAKEASTKLDDLHIISNSRLDNLITENIRLKAENEILRITLLKENKDQ